MKKAIFTKDGMKQVISTGYKLFDTQTNCLSKANCIANTMVGFYIRPYTQTGGKQQFPDGFLMDLDLKGYDLHNCPEAILEMVTSVKRTEPIKLYQFFVYPNNGSKAKVFGYGLCTAKDAFLACGLAKCEIYNQYRYAAKKYKAIMAAMQYVSDLGDPTTIAWTGCWTGLSKQGEEQYSQWVKPLSKQFKGEQ